MENFTHAYQVMYIVSKYLKVRYRYFNHTKSNPHKLFRKGVKGYQIRRLGSGNHKI